MPNFTTDTHPLSHTKGTRKGKMSQGIKKSSFRDQLSPKKINSRKGSNNHSSRKSSFNKKVASRKSSDSNRLDLTFSEKKHLIEFGNTPVTSLKNLQVKEIKPKVETSSNNSIGSPMKEKKKLPIMTVYLAGPDVFRPNAIEIGKLKQVICEKYGLKGHFPMDNKIEGSDYEDEESFLKANKSQNPNEADLKKQMFAMAIGRANEDLMKSSDAGIFNMTPYRGPSMDVGTAFEAGFMRSLGKPCFGYSNSKEDFNKRSRKFSDVDDTVEFDRDNNRFEEFDLMDNLMIPHAVLASSQTAPVQGTVEDINDYGSKSSLRIFENAIKQIVKYNQLLLSKRKMS